MARTARASKGGICYHVINRGNGRATVYHGDSDYRSFISLIGKASDRLPLRVLAFCLMPNHFHLVLWPYADGDLSRWMQWLLTSHVRRYHRIRGTSGRVWQGRFKAFPIQEDRHLLTVMRYVERNPVRANIVARASDWRWSSISGGVSPRWEELLTKSPVAKPGNWEALVDTPMNHAETEALRRCARRNAPYGDNVWTEKTARDLGLESSLRSRGRPSAI
ncbi:MAG: transposase [Woeseiaceae bacterium]|nr:transposase [Woeseiaceae bacterium]